MALSTQLRQIQNQQELQVLFRNTLSVDDIEPENYLYFLVRLCLTQF